MTEFDFEDNPRTAAVVRVSDSRQAAAASTEAYGVVRQLIGNLSELSLIIIAPGSKKKPPADATAAPEHSKIYWINDSKVQLYSDSRATVDCEI